MAPPFCIVIPSNNEEQYIEACLQALLGQDAEGPILVIVAANACTDNTVCLVRSRISDFAAKGWELRCLDLPDKGKIHALNAAEAEFPGPCVARAYLDADVVCDPQLISQIRVALTTDQPRYATGTLRVASGRSFTTRAYASVWVKLPFVKSGAVGAGFFAVNCAGRARWSVFPEIISDDTFVRLNFTPDERIETQACYYWPMVEGLRALIKVRRRQNAGVNEIAARWPDLLKNEGKDHLSLFDFLRLACQVPLGLVIYLTVHLFVRIGEPSMDWSRGR